jgi:hypothetical protein
LYKHKQARFTFDCWKISKEDLQFPNNRQRPITGTDLTGVCMSHNCCNYDHGASCNNDLIRTEVCKIDNYCCNVVWDKKCVALAGQNPVGSCDGYLPGPTGKHTNREFVFVKYLLTTHIIVVVVIIIIIIIIIIFNNPPNRSASRSVVRADCGAGG